MDGGTTGYQPNTQRYWDAMPRLDLNQAQRKQPEIAHQGHPAADGYDLLRTRILGEVAEREWTRVGVTQAATGRAAPLTALNLALSEARRPKRSILLLDLDIARQPVLRYLGTDLDTGRADGSFRLWRANDQLGVIAIKAAPAEAATRLLDPAFRAELDEVLVKAAPDIVVLHVPPLLAGDAGLAGLPLAQGLILVVDAQADTAARLRECQARMRDICPLLGLFQFDAEV